MWADNIVVICPLKLDEDQVTFSSKRQRLNKNLLSELALVLSSLMWTEAKRKTILTFHVKEEGAHSLKPGCVMVWVGTYTSVKVPLMLNNIFRFWCKTH